MSTQQFVESRITRLLRKESISLTQLRAAVNKLQRGEVHIDCPACIHFINGTCDIQNNEPVPLLLVPFGCGDGEASAPF